MIKSLTTFLFFLISLGLFSQIDSTKYEIHDVVNLKEGGVLKGEIMSFDEPSGGLVFKDLQGRVYSLSREDYDYFQENQPFPIGKKEIVLKARKNNDFAFEVGFDVQTITLKHYIDDDESVLYSNPNFFDDSFRLKLSGGKYFDDKNYAGVTFENAFSTYNKGHFAAGLRYKYIYDGQTRNFGLYVPLELKFMTLEGRSNVEFNDTTYLPDGTSYWPTHRDVNSRYQAINLSIGHGLAFIMSNKKSISLELAVQMYFGISEEHISLEEIFPNNDFSGVGLKGGISFEF